MRSCLWIIAEFVGLLTIWTSFTPAKASPIGSELFEANLQRKRGRSERDLRPRASVTAGTGSATDIVQNGDFSNGLVGWQVDTSACDGGDCTGGISDGGAFSAFVDAGNNEFMSSSTVALIQTLKNVDAGETYILSFDLKANYGDQGGEYVYVYVEGDMTISALGGQTSSGSGPNTITAAFTPQKANPELQFYFLVMNYSHETFEVDNIKVVHA